MELNESVILARLMDRCAQAYIVGFNEKRKTPLPCADLFNKVDWMRGMHKKLIRAAYLSGKWEKRTGQSHNVRGML